jgi:branched-chain amino acid aminotransferase
MKPSPNIWINGRIAPISKSKILSFHQGLNYGACVYEGIRCYRTNQGTSVLRLKEHLDRFFYSASVLSMKLGFTKAQVGQIIRDLIKKNKITSGYIRPIAFYSEPKMGINILNSEVTFLILTWPWDDTKLVDATTLSITKYRRLSPSSIDIKAKISGYYANGLLGFIDAKKAGFDLPLFLDEKGYLTESAISNIFIVKEKTLYTPTTRNILSGITRDTVISITKDLKLKVVEKDMKPEFLKNADEVFMTGTGIQLQAVKEIKGYFLLEKNPAITDSINEYYKKISKGEVAKYRKWLTQ